MISESVGGSGLTTAGAALAGVAVPIVAAEAYIFDELGMTGGWPNLGGTSGQDSVDVTTAGATHPLGAGFGGRATSPPPALCGHEPRLGQTQLEPDGRGDDRR